jgi:arabinose-5-phosphate isomerase
MSTIDKKCIEIAVQCLRDEADAILQQISRLDGNFTAAANLILNSSGKLVVTGVGKSGHIGAKIAATLSSTGTPSFYMNPLDAYHGDLGVCSSEDVVLAISNSGQTDELLRILPYFHQRNIPIIGISNNPQSLLARNSKIHIAITAMHEAEPLGLAPTTSTTATLALGDALACALMCARNFKACDFARFHPGGSLGKQLLTRAADVMLKDNLPIARADILLGEAVTLVSKGRLGLCLITSPDGTLEGIITDGDVRRAMESSQSRFFGLRAGDIMTRTPVTVSAETKISEVENIMHARKIHAVVVVDNERRVQGIVDSFRTVL